MDVECASGEKWKIERLRKCRVRWRIGSKFTGFGGGLLDGEDVVQRMEALWE